ncbi:single-stranded DNA-binding protein [Gleimia sp. 6138-11-ORH1]|uniref:single-stranded DNA-binding protein n=1 Tax=Gleimia sp. 6138-11-ORH1 TaxID=2973937 RepID=UPI0021670178|nr:single-stranded DNA-binding protein [Gleimia sp. 6138-11-ORH1]MCS4484919.1 single-stranded DNA-binding protein [Gleimia sp. 6138-11-ORH1]
MENEIWNQTEKPASQTANLTVQPIGKIRPTNTDAVNVTLRGRVGTAVEYSSYPSGASLARFRLAVARKGRDEAGQWHELGVTWYTVRMWGKLAENASHSLRKGEPVLVSGKLEVNEWASEANGTKGMELVIVANAVGHDLNFGLSLFNKISQPEPSRPHQMGNREREKPAETVPPHSLEAALSTVGTLKVTDSQTVADALATEEPQAVTGARVEEETNALATLG